ncbi:ribosome maturation factor RimP [Fulvivirgaceae bacterium BMA10]|uniref:Ribosome maturation factor RimP n=1 Tax=Splendidivirga corallicola TaxID=3051826 RepID=A0ABT8KLG8_9BACT|nr:ribosome maturation factor RimP [Fulvivirgaceae bacterium BMA10]
MDIKRELEKIVETNLKSDDLFLVDIIVSNSNSSKKVLILIDGDTGVNIDACAKLSRQIGEVLEEQALFDSPYTLEVSSPGVDHPLQMKRQYKKNVGRKVKVTLLDEAIKTGKLMAVNNETILINEEIKSSKRKMNYQETEISFETIKKTNVLVSFK